MRAVRWCTLFEWGRCFCHGSDQSSSTCTCRAHPTRVWDERRFRLGRSGSETGVRSPSCNEGIDGQAGRNLLQTPVFPLPSSLLPSPLKARWAAASIFLQDARAREKSGLLRRRPCVSSWESGIAVSTRPHRTELPVPVGSTVTVAVFVQKIYVEKNCVQPVVNRTPPPPPAHRQRYRLLSADPSLPITVTASFAAVESLFETPPSSPWDGHVDRAREKVLRQNLPWLSLAQFHPRVFWNNSIFDGGFIHQGTKSGARYWWTMGRPHDRQAWSQHGVEHDTECTTPKRFPESGETWKPANPCQTIHRVDLVRLAHIKAKMKRLLLCRCWGLFWDATKRVTDRQMRISYCKTFDRDPPTGDFFAPTRIPSSLILIIYVLTLHHRILPFVPLAASHLVLPLGRRRCWGLNNESNIFRSHICM